jgi:hypothetical protein
MTAIPYQTTNWDLLPATEHRGESGIAYWRTLEFSGLRIRKVTLSKNYKADHWCTLGHLVFCLEGEFVSELSDGRKHTMTPGMSYQVSNGISSHRSMTAMGATMLIVDGDFLKTKNKESDFNPWRM